MRAAILYIVCIKLKKSGVAGYTILSMNNLNVPYFMFKN